ncbi:MAG: hypothetical protein ABI212_10465 [Burkholderiaceae bacterium]
MCTSHIACLAWVEPTALRAFAIASLVTAVAIGTAACSPKRPISAVAAVAAPIAPASIAPIPARAPTPIGDPSVPSADHVFDSKMRDASAQPETF